MHLSLSSRLPRREYLVVLAGVALVVLLSCLVLELALRLWQLPPLGWAAGLLALPVALLGALAVTALLLPRVERQSGTVTVQLPGAGGSLKQTMLDGAEQVNVNAEKLAAAANEIVFAAQMQTMATDSVKSMIDEVSGSVAHVTSLAHELKGRSASAHETAGRGGTLVNGVATRMADIATAMTDAAQRMGGLSARARSIGDVATTIARITHHTNLLALNAAIEAARAGEHGRGFAIVAQEVKRLSKETADATRQISETIHQIQVDATESTKAVQLSLPLIESGVVMVRDAETALQAIRQHAEELMGEGNGLSTDVDQQSRLIQDMVSTMQQILDMSAQTGSVAERALETSVALSAIAAGMVQSAGPTVAPAVPAEPVPETASNEGENTWH